MHAWDIITVITIVTIIITNFIIPSFPPLPRPIMSATDARKLLAASRKSRRITSPYASYSLAGALFCNICSNTPIKSESLWDAHVSSPQHKSNVAIRGGTVSSGRNSHKRPAEASATGGDFRNENNGDGQGASKRLKTAKADVKNLALPVGFFDDDGDDDDEGIISTGEVIEPDDEDPTPAAQATNQQPPTTIPFSSSSSKLPADFFSTNSTSKVEEAEGNIDDEWAAFQADIAETEEEQSGQQPTATATINHTISAPALTATEIQQQNEDPTSALNARNARTMAEEEMEDARAAMADFFDEQSSLEERVARLKERREMLRQAGTPTSTGMPPPPITQGLHRSNSVRSVTMGGMDDYPSTVPELESEGSDDDYEDDDEMFLRRR
ncbi:hypothetical protein TWF718_003636 [Orbilia javanica]|uniref:Coiled-coil domain-containing protein 16 n=1 Tax=Orbilia javanica TaxID=47235 RepID=A0AAN8NA43_9PEZI